MDDTKRIVNKSLLTDIADAIRSKEESSAAITASDFPARILAIETGTEPTGTATFTSNGTYDVSTYASVVVNVPQDVSIPTLNAPSISRSEDTISLTNPSTNGNYNTGFRIYNDSELLFSQTSTSFSLINKLAIGDYELYAACYNGNNQFNDSPKSDTYIECSVFGLTRELTETTASNSTSKMSDGLDYTVTFTPTWGWWLPVNVHVYKKDNSTNATYTETDVYEWDQYTGVLTINDLDGNIRIVCDSEETPQLQSPEVEVEEIGLETQIVSVGTVRYAQEYDVYYDNTLIDTIAYESGDTLAEQISADTVTVTSAYVVTMSNDDLSSSRASNKSANITHYLYLDNVLVFQEKEGI